MSGLRIIPALFLAVLHGSLSAEVPENWSEEAEWQTVGQTFWLRNETVGRVYRSPEVQAEVTRVGVSEACPSAEDAIDEVMDSFAEEYRQMVIRALRERFTLAESYKSRFALTPNGGAASILKNRLIRVNGPFFESVEIKARMKVLRALEFLSPVTGDWRGRFDDWNFGPPSGIVFRIACSLETGSNPDQNRQAFDGFYRERPSQ